MIAKGMKAVYNWFVAVKSAATGLTAQANKIAYAVLNQYRFFYVQSFQLIRAGWMMDTVRYAGSLVPVPVSRHSTGPFFMRSDRRTATLKQEI